MVALHAERWDAEPLASPPRIADVVEILATKLPAWHADAACRDADPSIFFVERGQPTTEARAICARCAVVEECRQYAIDEGIEMGIFGGMSPGERRTHQRG